MKNVLVTGGAGFIGSHLIDSLLADDCNVTCIDNFDAFYPREIKEKNIAPHRENPNYKLLELDIRDYESLEKEVSEPYDVIVHLAAKAGVRPSIQDPVLYQQVNIQGTQNMLELAKKLNIKQFVFASSSSVYGVNPNVPWREDDHVLMPISPYAATKVSGELLGHVYAHLYGIRFIALRYFTVFGPRQRPDLAIHKFSKRMLEGTPIQVFGDGTTRRDYTYIDDIVQGIRKSMVYDQSQFEVINLGNNHPITMAELLAALENALGVAPKIERLPEQPGDVPQTYASIETAQRLLGYEVTTPIPDGLAKFNTWIRDYYKF